MSLCLIRNVVKLTTSLRQQTHPQLLLRTCLPSANHSTAQQKTTPFYEYETPEDPSVITVPLRLQKRLTKKLDKESTKFHQLQRIVKASRQGSKNEVIITARRKELNYRKGQTYGRNEEIPLASKGWLHKKSYGDFFIINSGEDSAFIQLDGRESFESLGLRAEILSGLQAENINTPTVIQATAIPEILKGKNNLLAAETGCGKTLAYLLPIFQQILESRTPRLRRAANKPSAVVLLPTRELAEQVFKVAVSLGQVLGVRVRLVQGGCVSNKIDNPSTKPVDIVISTVNIMSTLSAVNVYDLSRVNHVVLDEADSLLDDSFSDDVIRFLKRFDFDGSSSSSDGAPVVQATLVSATMPRSIETILEGVIPAETLNRISTPGLHRVVKTVPQKFMRVRKMDKPQIILSLVSKSLEAKQPVMIFANKTETCHWLNIHLVKNGIDCVAVHGKIHPGERRGLLLQYQQGEHEVLICTDLGSRGIDSIRTMHVINYEFPRFLADYVHRTGRVGRVGSAQGGQVTNLISGGNEVELVQTIERSVRKDESLERVNANIKRLLNAKYGMYKTIDPIDAEGEEKSYPYRTRGDTRRE